MNHSRPLVPTSSRLVPDEPQTTSSLVPPLKEGRGRGSGKQADSKTELVPGDEGVQRSHALGMQGVLIEAPEVQIFGDVVALRGQALRDAHRLMLRGVQLSEVRDGIAPSGQLASLLEVMRRAIRISEVPVTEFRNGGSSRESETSERIGTEEASQLMNLCSRRVRQIADELDGRKIAGRWTYDRALVEQAAQARK